MKTITNKIKLPTLIAYSLLATNYPCLCLANPNAKATTEIAANTNTATNAKAATKAKSTLQTKLNSKLTTKFYGSLPTYTAKYKIYWRGIRVGSSIHSLKQIKPNRYLAETITNPITPLIPFRYTESSEFTTSADSIKPYKYHFDNKKRGKIEHGTYQFDWNKMAVKNLAAKNGKDNTYSLQPGMQDKLSHIFQLQADMRKLSPNLKYKIAKNNEISEYSFEVLGEEVISTPIGKLATVKLELTSSNRIKRNFLWLAKDLNMTIVQSKQYRNNKLVGQLKIEDFQAS